MSNQITKSARKDHGLCRTCGQPILKGMSFRRTLMTLGRNGILWPGETMWRHQATIKIHLTCPHPDSRRNPMFNLFCLMAGIGVKHERRTRHGQGSHHGDDAERARGGEEVHQGP